MKILYHHRIGSKDGQYVHVEELTGALKKQGHQLFMSGPGSLDKKSYGGRTSWVSAMKRHVPRFVYELMEFGYSFIEFTRIVYKILTLKPDLLYQRYNLYLPAGVWAARMLRVPMMLEINAPLYRERKTHDGIALDRLAKWSEAYAWRGADKCLPVTGVLAREVMAVGVDAARIEVIHNGVNLKSFRPTEQRRALQAMLPPQTETVLGFVGFVRSWHGLELVLDLLREQAWSNVHLLVVGEGPAVADLKDYAATHGVADQVSFVGAVDRDQVADYVSLFDVALQPAVVEYASPLKLFEYMGLGKAIVAPDMENIREILVHEENGLLFDPNDPDTFKQAVRSIVGDVALRERLGRAAYDTIVARDLTWDGNARRVAALAEILIAEHASGIRCKSRAD